MKDTKDIKTLADLTPDGDNFNKHTEFGTKLLEDSLRKFGAGRSILVDKDGNIIAGNGVVETAAGIGMDDVVVVQTDGTKLVVVQRTDLELDTPQGRELALADNMTALKGIDLDLDKVRESLGDDLAKAWGMEIPEPQRQAKEDDFDPDKPVETVCKKGDIWKLGNHRLMCGDSTESGDVALLMDGKKADMVFTDPPYGVNVKGGKNGSENMIQGDLTQTAIPFSFEIAVKEALKDRGHLYFCGAECNLELYTKLFDRHLHILPKHLIWVKNGFTMKQNGYHNQYEIIYHGYKKGGGGIWYGGRKEDEASDVWQIKRDNPNEYEHPTQKPIEIPSRAIRNSSQEGDIVLDLFGGSGSTLIAAEQLNRRCYVMELDPHYCDVIIARWEKFTGNKAERISNGNE